MIFKFLFERISKIMLHMYEATLVGIHLFVSSKNLEHLFLYTSDCYLLFLESSGIISHTRPVELSSQERWGVSDIYLLGLINQVTLWQQFSLVYNFYAILFPRYVPVPTRNTLTSLCLPLDIVIWTYMIQSCDKSSLDHQLSISVWYSG